MTGAQAVQALLRLGYRFRLMPDRKLYLKYLKGLTPPPMAVEYTQVLKADIQSAVWLVDLLEKGFEPIVFPEQKIETDDPFTVEAYLLAEKRHQIEIVKMVKHPKQKNHIILVFRPLMPPCFIDINRYKQEVTPMQMSMYDTRLHLPA